MILTEITNKKGRARNHWIPQSTNSGRDESINAHNKKLTTLFTAPERVEGDFIVVHNKLTSLKHGPKWVGGDYNCRMNMLTSLQFAPEYIGADLICDDNCILSLHDVHKHIKHITGAFWFMNQKNLATGASVRTPTNLLGLCLVKHLGRIESGEDTIDYLFDKYRHDINMFQDALIDAGFHAQARL